MSSSFVGDGGETSSTFIFFIVTTLVMPSKLLLGWVTAMTLSMIFYQSISFILTNLIRRPNLVEYQRGIWLKTLSVALPAESSYVESEAGHHVALRFLIQYDSECAKIQKLLHYDSC